MLLTDSAILVHVYPGLAIVAVFRSVDAPEPNSPDPGVCTERNAGAREPDFFDLRFSKTGDPRA